MHHAPAVRVGHRVAHLGERSTQAPQRHLVPADGLPDHRSERPTLDLLHREVQPPVGHRPQIVDRRHPGVLELSAHLGLFEKSSDNR